MAFIRMPHVLVRRRRQWPRKSVADLLRRVENRGELHFSAAQKLATTICILKFVPISVYGKESAFYKNPADQNVNLKLSLTSV